MKNKVVKVFIICLVIACGACAGSVPAEPTATEVPPTATPVPPTETPIPPTDTPLPPTETPIPPTPTEAEPEFPTGEFFSSSFLYTLFIKEDGTWNVDAQAVVVGEYEVDGDQVIMTDESSWCSELGPGIYRWKFTDGDLKLSTVEDACDLRRDWLTVSYKQQ